MLILTTKTNSNYLEGPGISMTPNRFEILRGLGEHKFLTTNQVWQEILPSTTLRQVQRDLERLREKGLLRSLPLNPELGRASELVWQINRKGASVAGLNYGSHYYRRPTPALIRFKALQLNLVREVNFAGWELIKPYNSSPTNPLPDKTAQYLTLCQVITGLEKLAIEQARAQGYLSRQQLIDFEQGDYLRSIPRQLNDYLAFQTHHHLAVVLILCPPQAGAKFWQKRCQLYGRLARRVGVYLVFENQDLERAWASEVENSGFKSVEVGKVYELLRGLKVS